MDKRARDLLPDIFTGVTRYREQLLHQRPWGRGFQSDRSSQRCDSISFSIAILQVNGLRTGACA